MAIFWVIAVHRPILHVNGGRACELMVRPSARTRGLLYLRRKRACKNVMAHVKITEHSAPTEALQRVRRQEVRLAGDVRLVCGGTLETHKELCGYLPRQRGERQTKHGSHLDQILKGGVLGGA